jgi:hypothetical protein
MEPSDQPMRCGFCDRDLQQLTIQERDTVEGKIFVFACPHCRALLAAAGLGGPQSQSLPPRP